MESNECAQESVVKLFRTSRWRYFAVIQNTPYQVPLDLCKVLMKSNLIDFSRNLDIPFDGVFSVMT